MLFSKTHQPLSQNRRPRGPGKKTLRKLHSSSPVIAMALRQLTRILERSKQLQHQRTPVSAVAEPSEIAPPPPVVKRQAPQSEEFDIPDPMARTPMGDLRAFRGTLADGHGDYESRSPYRTMPLVRYPRSADWSDFRL